MSVCPKPCRKLWNICVKNIQGCVLGYTQSDEITPVSDRLPKKLTTDAWFWLRSTNYKKLWIVDIDSKDDEYQQKINFSNQRV